MAKLKEFSGEEDWLQYCERLEFYFVAHGVEDAGKKKATLLAACGATTYKLMCDLVSPLKPKDKTFEQLKEIVQKHLKPKPSEIVQRYKFHTRVQRSGETIANFVAELRHLSQDCNFGDSLSDMLRDRLVCGVKSERTQRRLLAETALTFENAFAAATAMETAERNAIDLQQTKAWDAGEGTSADSKMAPEQINKLQRKKNQEIECWFCEKRGHKEAECRFKKKLEEKLQKNKEGSDSDDDAHYVNYLCQFEEDSSDDERPHDILAIF